SSCSRMHSRSSGSVEGRPEALLIEAVAVQPRRLRRPPRGCCGSTASGCDIDERLRGSTVGPRAVRVVVEAHADGPCGGPRLDAVLIRVVVHALALDADGVADLVGHQRLAALTRPLFGYRVRQLDRGVPWVVVPPGGVAAHAAVVSEPVDRRRPVEVEE